VVGLAEKPRKSAGDPTLVLAIQTLMGASSHANPMQKIPQAFNSVTSYMPAAPKLSGTGPHANGSSAPKQTPATSRMQHTNTARDFSIKAVRALAFIASLFCF
jgi:hypothetical protein